MSGAINWHEWDGDLGPSADVVYVRRSRRPGELSLLAQSFKIDGVSVNAAESYRDAERAIFVQGYLGRRASSLWEVACDADGATADGDVAVEVCPCVFALLGADDR